jgi:hypothetical protein
MHTTEDMYSSTLCNIATLLVQCRCAADLSRSYLLSCVYVFCVSFVILSLQCSRKQSQQLRQRLHRYALQIHFNALNMCIQYVLA